MNFLNAQREFLIGYIWEEYKSLHGVSPRFADFDGYCLSELREWADQIQSDLQWENTEAELGEDAWKTVDLGQAPANTPFATLLSK